MSSDPTSVSVADQKVEGVGPAPPILDVKKRLLAFIFNSHDDEGRYVRNPGARTLQHVEDSSSANRSLAA